MPPHRLSLTHLLGPHWKPLSVAFSPCSWKRRRVAGAVAAEDRVRPRARRSRCQRGSPNDAGGSGSSVSWLAALAVIAVAAWGGQLVPAEVPVHDVAKRVGYDLRRLLYHHVQRLSLSFYEQRQTGDMVVRLTSDIDATESFVSSAALGIVLDGIMMVGMMGVMFYLDWRFQPHRPVGRSLSVPHRLSLTRRIKKAARAVKQKESELASVVQESISSVRVVKAFAREDFEERLRPASQESVALSLRARNIKARLSPLVDVIVAIGTCLVLWFGVRLVLEGRLTSGALLVFILYLEQMYKPMKDLSKMADTLSKAAVGFERIAEILDGRAPGPRPPWRPPGTAFKGRIEFAHVSIRISAPSSRSSTT